MILLYSFPPPLPHASTYISLGGQGSGYKFASPQSKLPLIWSWFCQGRSKYGAETLGIWAIKVRAGEAETEANFWSKRLDPGILAPSYMYFWPSLHPPPRHPFLHKAQIIKCRWVDHGARMLTTSWVSRGPRQLQVRPSHKGWKPTFYLWPRTRCCAQHLVPNLCNALTEHTLIEARWKFHTSKCKIGQSIQFPHLCRHV